MMLAWLYSGICPWPVYKMTLGKSLASHCLYFFLLSLKMSDKTPAPYIVKGKLTKEVDGQSMEEIGTFLRME